MRPVLVLLIDKSHKSRDVRKRKIMTQSDLSTTGPVGVVKRDDAGHVKKLIDTPESTTYTLEIREPEPPQRLSADWQGLPFALGSAALAVLTLIDSVKLDR